MSDPTEPAIDAAAVAKVAKLARLRLSEDELSAMAGQMADILGYVDRLKAIDVSGVEPMAHPADAVGVPRADELSPGLDRDAALRNAPKSDGRAFVVPQILDGDS